MINQPGCDQDNTSRFIYLAAFLILLILAACTKSTVQPTNLAPKISATAIATRTPLPATNTNTTTPISPSFNNPFTAYLSTVNANQTLCNPSTVEAANLKKIPTSTPSPKYRPTGTPTPTSGIALSLPLVTVQTIGSQFASASTAIDADNYLQLANVAQWGKGNINAVTYKPDGSVFVVGSSLGIAVYTADKPAEPPRWVPFDEPFDYDDMYFSRDGNYLLLVKAHYNYEGDSIVNQVRNFTDGTIVKSNPDSIEWMRDTQLIINGEGEVISLDGNLQMKTYTTRNEDYYVEAVSHRDIYDNQTKKPISSLSDESTYVYYKDRSSPEGCDLSSFSYCGNVYDPMVMLPSRAGFSPTGKTLTIMYRPTDLNYPERFSTLRIYKVNDGSFITNIGSFTQPVQSFAYSSDGNQLLIGYVNGSIQIWDIPQAKEVFNAWHFNAPIDYLSYSYDGRYLLIQRMGNLEVRSTMDGELNGRYTSTVFATSPVANLVAIADEQGGISVNNIASGQALYHIQAHTAPIYALAFSPDGKTLVSSGEDCDVRDWDVATGASIHLFEETWVDPYAGESNPSRIFIYYMNFIPGTNTLIGFGSWGTSVAWNIDSGARQYVVESAPMEYYQGMVTLNPHFPESFAVEVSNNEFYIDSNGYNLKTGAFIGPYQYPQNVPYGCSLAGPHTKDGKLLFTIGIDNLEGRICILNAQDYSFFGSIEVIPPNANNSRYIGWLYLSPNGQQLIVTTNSGTILVYEVISN